VRPEGLGNLIKITTMITRAPTFHNIQDEITHSLLQTGDIVDLCFSGHINNFSRREPNICSLN
jgi:hypothetical protein